MKCQILEKKRKAEIFFEKLKKLNSFKKANGLIKKTTSIVDLFQSEKELKEFIHYIDTRKEMLLEESDSSSKDLGDIQTPFYLIKKIFKILLEQKFDPDIVVEPTFGRGHFIQLLPNYFPDVKKIYGVEIQKRHFWHYIFLAILNGLKRKRDFKCKISLYNEDFFQHQFDESLLKDKTSKFLFIGNPPWVTLSELSILKSENRPETSNVKKFSGIQAITGSSNFDIGESIITKLIQSFSNKKGKIALLCKDIVIRNIFKQLPSSEFKLSNIYAIKFDARKVFNANCEASIFLADLESKKSDLICKVSTIDSPFEIINEYGWVNDDFVSNVRKYTDYSFLDGNFDIKWRQGIKHNCSKVLELEYNEQGQLMNKLDEKVKIENDLIFPLLKGSDLTSFEIKKTEKMILLTQTKLNESTQFIQKKYPKTWNYLIKYQVYFDMRMSKVFQANIPYSIFGVGDYSFSPYKVAVASFYKTPKFSLIKSVKGKPTQLDDTCYYLSFKNYEKALFICTMLNSDLVKEFLDSIAFYNTKRPFTKDILMRIDLKKLIENTEFDSIREIWKANDYPNKNNFTVKNFNDFKKKMSQI